MTLDDDFNVPDSKPDILRLLKTDGDIRINEKKQMNGKLLLSGSLMFRILYISEDSSRPLHTLQGELPFSESVNLSEECGQLGLEALNLGWEFEDLTASILNSRKFTLRSLVLFSIGFDEPVSHEVVVEVNGDAQLFSKKTTLSLTGTVNSKKDTLRLREEVTLPNAKPSVAELLYYELRLCNADTRLGADKVTVNGDLSFFLCYLGEKESSAVEYYETEIPISASLDCSGCTETMIPYITLHPTARSVELRPDADGEERRLALELTLDVNVKLYEEQELSMVSDLYSTRESLHTEYAPMEYEALLQRNNSRVRLSNRLVPDSSVPKLLQICHSSSNIKLDSVQVTGEGLLAEGVIDVDLFSVSSDDSHPLEVLKTTIPFSQIIEIHGITPDCTFEVHTNADQLSAIFADQDTIEIKAGVSFDCIAFSKKTVPILVDCVLQEPDFAACARKPPISAYSVRPQDTLWDIAKHFSTSEAAICEINELSDGVLTPGELLLVVRECSGI